jgi:hypothetical protein
VKAINHSIVPRQKREYVFRPAALSRAEAFVFAMLGATGMLAVFIALISASNPEYSREDPLADVRTQMQERAVYGEIGVCGTCGCLAGTCVQATNGPERARAQRSFSTPTNAVAAKPKA